MIRWAEGIRGTFGVESAVGIVVYRFRSTYHLQTCCCESDDSPWPWVALSVVLRTADVAGSKSCCTAAARKSSLLAPSMFPPWKGAEGSTYIHELSSKPIIGVLKLLPNGVADTGLVG